MTRHLTALSAVLAAPSLALAAESERGLMDIVFWEMLFTVIVFGIFFAILSTAVWPKILGGLQAREDKQREDLASAEKAKAEAEKTLAEYSEKLAEARKEAQSIVAEARTAAQQAANADKAKIEAEIAQMKAAAKADIDAARESALSDLYAQAATLSTTIAGKILKREINESDQQSLVNESVEQFKANAASN
ncbi:MAG: F0F1 ATP synthase subunit B [Planctomycetota bacterium]